MPPYAEPSNNDEMTTLAFDAQTMRMLVSGARNGDRAAAERLVKTHDHWIRSVIFGVTGRRQLVDDVAQQVWAQVWERLDSLRDAESLRPWLYRIARNAAIDAGISHSRRRSREVNTEAGHDVYSDPAMPSPLRVAIGDELQRAILQAIQGLPLIYREPFVLRHLEDWSYAQIGDLLSLPVETVETRLVRARRLLRETLTDKI